MTRDDLLRALAGEPKAEQAIFWWCFAWHSGKRSDLYRILCESPYTPPLPSSDEKERECQKREMQSADLMRCWDILSEKFGPLQEVPYRKIRFDEVEEGDIIVAGAQLLCLDRRWPCRVIYDPREGGLAVVCKDGFHRLRPDAEGFLHGFRR